MTRFVAFLRAVNVGGHVIAMTELRRHFEGLGFSQVETFIASGNVIFSAGSSDSSALETRIESRLQEALGYEVKTFLRQLDEVHGIVRHRPFRDKQVQDSAIFVVGFLAQPLTPGARKALMALKSEFDDFHVHGRELYWISRRKQSESVFSNALFEKTLKLRTTFRGMNTILRLAAKYPSEVIR